MRILFLGSGPFAIPTLEALAKIDPEEHEFLGLLSRPDQPGRRGRKLLPMPAKARALELGIEVRSPDSVNHDETLDELRTLDIDLCIVADYGEILRAPFLDLARIGTFNLHGSILPKYRGAAPIVHAMIAGEEESGVTLFRIETGLDSGPIVAISRTPIGAAETAGELEARLASMGADLLIETLESFANGSIEERVQDHSQATLAPKIDKKLGLIDWSSSSREIERAVRALNPWPLAYSFLARDSAEERTAFLKVRSIDESPDARENDAPAGSVIAVSKKAFTIACGDGALEILELQRQGKAAMNANAYLNGRALKAGDQFVSPKT